MGFTNHLSGRAEMMQVLCVSYVKICGLFGLIKYLVTFFSYSLYIPSIFLFHCTQFFFVLYISGYLNNPTGFQLLTFTVLFSLSLSLSLSFLFCFLFSIVLSKMSHGKVADGACIPYFRRIYFQQTIVSNPEETKFDAGTFQCRN